MEYDNTFNTTHAFEIDIRHWDHEHRAFWTERLGRRYLLSVVPTRSRRGRILEIGAASYNKYQKEVVGRENELTVIDIKPSHHPNITAIHGLDRYIQFDMTETADASDASGTLTLSDCRGYFDEIRSWGVLSHYGFSVPQCERYLDNIHGFLKAGGQAIFKLDRDTFKVKKHSPSVSVEFLEDLIRARFTVVHTDVLSGNTPGNVHYVEKTTSTDAG
jgi:hypothetical protein